MKEDDKSATGNSFWDKDEYTEDFLATFRIYFISDKYELWWSQNGRIKIFHRLPGDLTSILCKEESFWFLLSLEHHSARDGWVKWRSSQEEPGKYKTYKSLESMTQEGNGTGTSCPCTCWGWEINVSACSKWNFRWNFGNAGAAEGPQAFLPLLPAVRWGQGVGERQDASR